MATLQEEKELLKVELQEQQDIILHEKQISVAAAEQPKLTPKDPASYFE